MSVSIAKQATHSVTADSQLHQSLGPHPHLCRGALTPPHMSNLTHFRQFHPTLHHQLHAGCDIRCHESCSMAQSAFPPHQLARCSRRPPPDGSVLPHCGTEGPRFCREQDSGRAGRCTDDCLRGSNRAELISPTGERDLLWGIARKGLSTSSNHDEFAKGAR